MLKTNCVYCFILLAFEFLLDFTVILFVCLAKRMKPKLVLQFCAKLIINIVILMNLCRMKETVAAADRVTYNGLT